MKLKAPCKHKKTWLISSSSYEWCYECGALRRMACDGPHYVHPLTKWTRPTGKDGDNPYPMKEIKR